MSPDLTLPIVADEHRKAKLSASAGGLVRRAPWDIAAILLIGVVAELLVHPAVDFPSNDDWVYGLAVKQILSTGIFAAPSPTLPDLVLQAYWGALFCLPFGFSFVALRISTLVLAAAGLVATYAFCREIGGSRGSARVLVLTLALDPLYFYLANSFMTDVPHVAMMAASLWAFARGMRRGNKRWIGAAIGIALATILVRQFAIVLVLALCVAWAAEQRWSRRSVIVSICVLAFGMAEHLGFQYWLVHSGRTPHAIVEITRDIYPPLTLSLVPFMAVHGFALLQYLGLMLAPIYLATGFASARQAVASRPAITIAILACVSFGEAMVLRMPEISLPNYGNILQPYGVGPLSLRDTVLAIHQPIIPAPLVAGWAAARALGIVVAAAIAVDFAELIRSFLMTVRDRRMEWRTILPLVLIGGYGAGVLLMTAVHGAFDRYLLSLFLPLAMVAVFKSGAVIRGRGWAVAAALVLAVFAGFSVAAVHDYLVFQRGRLAASDALEATGVPARDIEGGYEYDGFRTLRADYQQAPGTSVWWHTQYPYVITTGPLPGYVVDARYDYRRWLTGENATIMAMKRADLR